MKRLALAASLLATLLSAHPTGAQEPVDETGTVADEAPAVQDWRVSCIEARESGGANVWRGNTAPVYGDKPAGVLQYFESTFRPHAAEMGHPEYSRWVPWQARLVAEHDLDMGRRWQWTVGGCN